MGAKTIFLVALSAILIVAVFFLDPIAQDPAYYEFADDRTLLALPNFWNVTSNLAFFLVGAAGLFYLRSKNRPGVHLDLHVAYRIFFAGVFLTGIGSAYFHYVPGNDSLVWDRLPMTIGFMALLAIIIGEYISLRAAKKMMIPLLMIGAASVFYWAVTEARGIGDLRPYAVVQFLPMLLIPLILLMYRPGYDKTGFLWIVIGFYVLSKLFEYFDVTVYEFGGLISGHSVKHIVAALAPLVLLYGLDGRRPVNSESAAR